MLQWSLPLSSIDTALVGVESFTVRAVALIDNTASIAVDDLNRERQYEWIHMDRDRIRLTAQSVVNRVPVSHSPVMLQFGPV